jgi:hypothetical protein
MKAEPRPGKNTPFQYSKEWLTLITGNLGKDSAMIDAPAAVAKNKTLPWSGLIPNLKKKNPFPQERGSFPFS